jgi:NADPH-dependent 2,4-dienoyl-CoA reductase/sulfur reductase-like enzyme
LQPGERGADAEVDSFAEGEVTLSVACDVEALGILESPRVAIGGSVEQEHTLAGGDCVTSNCQRLRGRPSVELQR